MKYAYYIDSLGKRDESYKMLLEVAEGKYEARDDQRADSYAGAATVLLYTHANGDGTEQHSVM